MARRNQHPEPAEHLSERAKALWRDVLALQAKASPGRLALLQVGLEALDRADEARQVIEREGMTTKTATTGVLHVHPLLKVEREARQVFLRAWGQLNLDWQIGWDDRRT